MFDYTPLSQQIPVLPPNDGHRRWDRPRRYRWTELLGHARRIKPRCARARVHAGYAERTISFADAGTLLPPVVPQPTLSAYAGFHVFNGDG